jgi:hypothetical protein
LKKLRGLFAKWQGFLDFINYFQLENPIDRAVHGGRWTGSILLRWVLILVACHGLDDCGGRGQMGGSGNGQRRRACRSEGATTLQLTGGGRGERERGKVGEADGGLTEVGPTVRW